MSDGQTRTETEKTPQILRCDETGRCWQVESWPDTSGKKSERQRSNVVVLKRGELVITGPVEIVFEKYAVVC